MNSISMIEQLNMVKEERFHLLQDQMQIKESRIKLENDLKELTLNFNESKDSLNYIEDRLKFILDKINLYDSKILYINDHIDEYEQCEEMFQIKKELEDEIKEFKEGEKNFESQLIEIQEKKENNLEKMKLLTDNINIIQNYEFYLSEKIREIDNGILMFENLIREQQIKELIEDKKNYEFEKYKYKDIKSKFNDVIIYDTCHICLENYLENDDISIFSCDKHIFHFKCLNEWMLYKPICPICKSLYLKKEIKK